MPPSVPYAHSHSPIPTKTHSRIPGRIGWPRFYRHSRVDADESILPMQFISAGTFHLVLGYWTLIITSRFVIRELSLSLLLKMVVALLVFGMFKSRAQCAWPMKQHRRVSDPQTQTHPSNIYRYDPIPPRAPVSPHPWMFPNRAHHSATSGTKTNTVLEREGLLQSALVQVWHTTLSKNAWCSEYGEHSFRARHLRVLRCWRWR